MDLLYLLDGVVSKKLVKKHDSNVAHFIYIALEIFPDQIVPKECSFVYYQVCHPNNTTNHVILITLAKPSSPKPVSRINSQSPP